MKKENERSGGKGNTLWPISQKSVIFIHHIQWKYRSLRLPPLSSSSSSSFIYDVNRERYKGTDWIYLGAMKPHSKRIVIIFEHYSRILQSTVFLFRLDAKLADSPCAYLIYFIIWLYDSLTILYIYTFFSIFFSPRQHSTECYWVVSATLASCS